jgi:hypothetical protein
MHRQHRPRDALIALFVLGAFLLLPPFLLVFNRPEPVLGIPLFYLYLFLAWALLIGLGAAAARRLGGEAHDAAHPIPGVRRHPAEARDA